MHVGIEEYEADPETVTVRSGKHGLHMFTGQGLAGVSLSGPRPWRVAILRRLAQADGCALIDGQETPIASLPDHFSAQEIEHLAEAVARGDA